MNIEQNQILEQISKLTKVSQSAFAAACAIRTWRRYVDDSPSHQDVSRNFHELSSLLKDCLLGRTEVARGRLGLDKCMQMLLDNSDEADGTATSFEIDSFAALAYAFRCLFDDDIESVASAAGRAYDAADRYAVDNGTDPFDSNSSKWVQVELMDQMNDLSTLKGPGRPTTVSLEAVFTRAMQVPAINAS